MIAFLIFLPFLVIFGLFAVYAERKVAAFIQDRYGPMHVGYWGLLQTIADILKLLQKEDIVPIQTDKHLFNIAPIVVFAAFFAGFAAMPLAPGLVGAGVQVGIFYIIAIISLDIMGILMAGWGSNNKYALLGAMRSVAQIISYEIPTGLAILCVVVVSQSLDLQEISFQQGIWVNWENKQTATQNYLFGLAITQVDLTNTGGFLTWNIFRVPPLFFVFIIFFIATLAECNRAPFDLPEAESELVAGFHAEYSGMKFAFFMLAEYGMMLLVSFLAVILFLGSWNTALPNMGFLRLADWTSAPPNTLLGQLWGAFWLLSKAFLLIFLQMWIRWTYPRLRVDQLMYLCWKVLIPFSLALLFLTSLWKMGM